MNFTLKNSAIQTEVARLKFRTKAFINGTFCPSASGKTYASINPANGTTIANISACNEADVNRAVAVAVVDAANRLLGMISDRDLLKLFSGHKVGIWDRIASRLTFSAMGQRHKAAIEDARKRTAGEIMRTDIVSVREETSLDEVVRLMTSKQLKRLPVTGPHGELLGVISRDAVLRAGL